MQIELTPAQNSFIDIGIQEGRFRDREEAVKQALALWEARERSRIELLTSLDAAEQALDRGEGEDYSPDNLGSLVEAVRDHGKSSLNRHG
jgi:putative addiction module CopG family antidote